MKLLIAGFTLMQILALLSSNTPFANRANLNTYTVNGLSKVSKAELTRRFNDILDKELSGKDVCVSTPAARQLNDLMSNAAATVVREKAFDKIPEAETNIKDLARRLQTGICAEDDPGESTLIRITPYTINCTLHYTGSRTSSSLSLCPLFPICK
jgi:hypothetical protein